jgi:hypothetical protein
LSLGGVVGDSEAAGVAAFLLFGVGAFGGHGAPGLPFAFDVLQDDCGAFFDFSNDEALFGLGVDGDDFTRGGDVFDRGGVGVGNDCGSEGGEHEERDEGGWA